MTWDPYAHAGQHFPDWVIRFEQLHGVPELMCWRRRVVLIDPDYYDHLSPRDGRRSCMAHALGHLTLMHQGSVFDGKEEHAANRWAAGMLIDVRALADAAEWHRWEIGDDLAAALHVDLDTLICRVEMARRHAAEHGYLAARRNRLEHVA